MKAMILAAGLGTRLRPLTDDRPKALVTVAGHTLLEITLLRLRSFGACEVIVNTHHYADMISRYLRDNSNFGMHIEVSREEVLLDTGGGLKAAASFFLRTDGGSQEPFILHNVDVISYLLFDQHGHLCGRRIGRASQESEKTAELARPAKKLQALAFSGIHIISPRIFAKMQGESVFSIISTYLHLAASEERVLAFRADEYYWRDLGRPESIAQAAVDINNGMYPIS